MVQKPKIQYVGQFYVHGSEARQLQLEQERKARTSVPAKYLQKVQKIYVDPVAIAAILVSAVMLAVMAVGALQIRQDWQDYNRMSGYVSTLKQQNAEKTRKYHESYDLEDIRTKAKALGLVPVAEVSHTTMTVVMPEPEPEVRRIDEIKASLEGLFE